MGVRFLRIRIWWVETSASETELARLSESEFGRSRRSEIGGESEREIRPWKAG